MTFESERISQDVILLLKDRSGKLLDKLVFADSTEKSTTFDLLFPNTMYIEIETDNCLVHLKSMSLSGLSLTDYIIDQICSYQPVTSNAVTVTRSWYQTGTVSIDFFAPDWIQYHLLYRNKITKS